MLKKPATFSIIWRASSLLTSRRQRGCHSAMVYWMSRSLSAVSARQADPRSGMVAGVAGCCSAVAAGGHVGARVAAVGGSHRLPIGARRLTQPVDQAFTIQPSKDRRQRSGGDQLIVPGNRAG